MRAGPLLVPTLIALVTASSLGAAAPAVAAEGPTAAVAAAARVRRSAGPVVSPRPGGVLRAHRVRIRVHASDAPGALRVRLNGVAVGSDFGPSRGGVRTLVTSVSHGLRRGRNVLRVTVPRSGRSPQRATVRFTVRTRRALTGAGRDRRIAIGATASMVGRTHGLPRASRPSARWRVVAGPGVRRTPAGRPRTRARSAQRNLANGLPLAALTPPLLASPAGLAASFRPVVPGRYTLRLTSGSGAARSSDEVTLTAVPRTPLVPIDTMAALTGEGRGIRVGETTYRLRDAQGAPQSTAVPALQVVVLDRDTLSPISNKAYGSSQQAIPELKALHDDEQLVIVSLQAGDASTSGDFDGIDQGLAQIGFPAGRLPIRPGSFSGVGVPRMEPGEADVSVVPFSMDTGRIATYGRLQGYLSPDQYLNYGFVPSERVPFRYVAPDSPCGPGASCAASVGFRVRVQDWKTLNPARGGDGIVYQTGRPGLGAAQQSAEAQSMVRNLAAVEDGNLVTIQAVSTRDGAGYLPPIGEIDRATMTALAETIARFGGTRNALNRIARTTGPAASGGSTYTLVGWKDAGEGEGAEVAANVDGAGPAPALSGVLRPDRESRFRPAEVSSTSRLSADPTALASLVMQEPEGEWPLSDPRHAAAIAYIGGTLPRLGSDPRTAYWTQSFTESDTNALIRDVTNTAYRADDRFSPREFVEARDQLVLELGLVGNVRSYLSKLQQPFSEGQLSQWVTAQTVADRVLEDAENPDDEVTLSWLELTAQVLELLGPATEEVTGVLGGLLDIGMWAYGSTKSGGPSEGEMRVHADAFGKALVDRAEQAKVTIDRMGDVIVGDYAKLAIVGRYGSCLDCPARYAYLALAARDMSRNRAQIDRGVERLAYQKLLPLGFPVMALTRIGRHNDWPRSTAPDVRNYVCNGYQPWKDYEGNASTSLLQELDPAGRVNAYDTFVMSRPPGISTGHGTPPSNELLELIFGAERLGMDPGAFMAAARHRTWFSTEDRERSACYWLR